MYFKSLHMFRQMNFRPKKVFIKELQVLTASKYKISGFTVEVFTHVTI
jgi:hypothetical protein